MRIFRKMIQQVIKCSSIQAMVMIFKNQEIIKCGHSKKIVILKIVRNSKNVHDSKIILGNQKMFMISKEKNCVLKNEYEFLHKYYRKTRKYLLISKILSIFSKKSSL